MSQVGRIGGHLLDPNLERQGIDLAFKNTNFDATPILYLDVTNNRIGVKTDSPQYDLDIQTDVSTTNAEATALKLLAASRLRAQPLEPKWHRPFGKHVHSA